MSFPFGDAHVFFPEAGDDRCTAAVLVVVDPFGLIRRRGRKGQESFSLAGYVNNRPYAASSFLSVVLSKGSTARPPAGRKAFFVGDLVDRGPDSPGVLRLAMGMVRDGTWLPATQNSKREAAPFRTRQHLPPSLRPYDSTAGWRWPGRSLMTAPLGG